MNRTMTILSLSLLGLALVAAPVMAKDGQAAADRREAMQEKQAERRDAAKDAYHAHCDDPVNETVAKRCEQAKDFAHGAMKARREAVALRMAIHATERQLARANHTEARLQARLDNSTDANETARLEKRLERLDALEGKLEKRLERLEARLEQLQAKWAEAREKLIEHRAAHHAADADGEAAAPSSPAPSSSAAAA